MTDEYFGEHVAEVGGHCQVAALEPTLGRQTWPFAINSPAFHFTADDQHRVPVSVVGPPITILGDGATELRHRQHDDIGHPIAELGTQRGNPVREFFQSSRALSLRRPLAHMRVPPADFRKSDLDADVHLYQLDNLL